MAEITPEAIDRAAKFLRETQGAGKNLTPWATTLKATKKKWLVLAEGTLRAALEETKARPSIGETGGEVDVVIEPQPHSPGRWVRVPSDGWSYPSAEAAFRGPLGEEPKDG